MVLLHHLLGKKIIELQCIIRIIFWFWINCIKYRSIVCGFSILWFWSSVTYIISVLSGKYEYYFNRMKCLLRGREKSYLVFYHWQFQLPYISILKIRGHSQRYRKPDTFLQKNKNHYIFYHMYVYCVLYCTRFP